MHNLPFDKPGQFYRGNLHTHSTQSDGRLTPEQLGEFYRAANYDFLAITDHFLESYGFPMTDSCALRTPDFTTLTGAELHAGQTEFGNQWHILAVGLPLDFAPPQLAETAPQITARALASGAFVAIAHPYWYVLTEADARSLGDVHAIEVFNGTSIDYNDKADSWYFLDLLLARGYRYQACAVDDAHFFGSRVDACLGWVYVKSEELSPEALLAALKAGHYYSSTGPQIHDICIYPGEKVIVKCSPASRVYLTGNGWTAISAPGVDLCEAELDLQRFHSPYGRITVRDAQGKRAWSNPFWLE